MRSVSTHPAANTRVPTAKYTKMGETLRHVIPGHMQCSMACGGKACKYENPSRWSDEEQAVKGLYSSWWVSQPTSGYYCVEWIVSVTAESVVSESIRASVVVVVMESFCSLALCFGFGRFAAVIAFSFVAF